LILIVKTVVLTLRRYARTAYVSVGITATTLGHTKSVAGVGSVGKRRMTMTDREAQMREAGLMMDLTKAINSMAVGDTPLALYIYGSWSDEDILFIRRNRFGKRLLELIPAIPEEERDEILKAMEDDLTDLAASIAQGGEE
jgi:hypothetical protein